MARPGIGPVANMAPELHRAEAVGQGLTDSTLKFLAPGLLPPKINIKKAPFLSPIRTLSLKYPKPIDKKLDPCCNCGILKLNSIGKIFFYEPGCIKKARI